MHGLGGLQIDATVLVSLTLGELEALTCARLASLLTLAGARVTSHMAFLLEVGTELAVHLLKCACDAEANRTGLAVETAALCFDCDVDLIGHLDCLQGRECRILELFGLEVAFRILAVDFNLASAASEADTCGCSLATADGYKCFFAHYIKCASATLRRVLG